jgi:hypothetical protein
MAALNVSALLDALSSSHGDKMIREAVGTWLGAAPVKVKKASKPKKAASDDDSSAAEDKPKRAGPDAWNAFINLVCGPKDAPTSGYSAWLEDNSDKKGNKRFSYAKEMKGEGDRDYEAFKADFKSSASSASSAVSAASEAKPKRKPGRPSKASVAAGAGAGALLSESEDEAPKPKAKAKAAPKPKAAAAETAPKPKKAPKKASLPALPVSDDEDDGITKISLYDQEFFWDAEVGTLYEVKDNGSRGEIIGSYDGSSAAFS